MSRTVSNVDMKNVIESQKLLTKRLSPWKARLIVEDTNMRNATKTLLPCSRLLTDTAAFLSFTSFLFPCLRPINEWSAL